LKSVDLGESESGRQLDEQVQVSEQRVEDRNVGQHGCVVLFGNGMSE
jgi:hypothetical protein